MNVGRYRLYSAHGFLVLVCPVCNGGGAVLQGEIGSWSSDDDQLTVRDVLAVADAHEHERHPAEEPTAVDPRPVGMAIITHTFHGLTVLHGDGWAVLRCEIYDCLRLDIHAKPAQVVADLINMAIAFHRDRCLSKELG